MVGKSEQYGSTKQSDAVKENPRPTAQAVEDFHTNSDTDVRAESIHHTCGPSGTQAAPGNHRHDGTDSELLLSGMTISGSRGGNVALLSIIQALVRLGVIDSSTP